MWMTNHDSKPSVLASKVAQELNIKPVLLSTVLAVSATLTGCGGDTVSPVSEQVEEAAGEATGNLVFALTDAEEDFVSYTIGVNSVLLTRENGDQIEVLGEQTQVDFVEYQELTELFSIVKAPVGKYTSIVMELDYSEAYIVIQDENGNSYEAQAVDESEVPLTTYQVEFQLAESEELEIKGNQLSQLTLDLDLSSSNTILSFEPALVQVEPFVIGTASMDEDREHRVRGALASVNAETNTLTVNIRPMAKKQGEFGEFDVVLDDESVIEVDGEVLSLADAMTNLAEQGDDFPIVAYGAVSIDEATDAKSLDATQILAGSSVPWFGKDVFKGMVSDLMDGVTYVSGLTIDTDAVTREHISNQTFITSDSSQFVSRTSEEVDVSYLVPGQRIEALGQWSGADAETVNFDASDETIRILLSKVMGQVVSVDENDIVTLDVARFNKRPEKLIKRRHNKKQNGEASNVELDNVLVDISGLSQVEVLAGDWINAVGFVSPNSVVEGEVDMTAKAVTKFDVSETELTYIGFWGRQGGTPTISDSAIIVSTESGEHGMKYRFNPENVMPELSQVTFIAGGETKQFAIRQRGEQTEFFDDYSAYLVALSAKLEDDNTVNGLQAKGMLNQETGEFSVESLVVKLN